MQLRGYDLDAVAQFDTPALTFQWLDHVLRGALARRWCPTA